MCYFVNMINSKTFTALVSFERMSLHNNQILSDEIWGAVGYMAVRCDNSSDAWKLFRTELHELGLRLLDVAEMKEFTSIDQVAEIDAHLANNVEAWETGKETVWGTLHNYYAEGEA